MVSVTEINVALLQYFASICKIFNVKAKWQMFRIIKELPVESCGVVLDNYLNAIKSRNAFNLEGDPVDNIAAIKQFMKSSDYFTVKYPAPPESISQLFA
jgi:hypothetical protein